MLDGGKLKTAPACCPGGGAALFQYEFMNWLNILAAFWKEDLAVGEMFCFTGYRKRPFQANVAGTWTDHHVEISRLNREIHIHV